MDLEVGSGRDSGNAKGVQHVNQEQLSVRAAVGRRLGKGSDHGKREGATYSC